jgi:hypothetical protein
MSNWKIEVVLDTQLGTIYQGFLVHSLMSRLMSVWCSNATRHQVNVSHMTALSKLMSVRAVSGRGRWR